MLTVIGYCIRICTLINHVSIFKGAEVITIFCFHLELRILNNCDDTVESASSV